MNHSCLLYDAPRTIHWSLIHTNTCQCSSIYAHRHEQSTDSSVRCSSMNIVCHFDEHERMCRTIVNLLMNTSTIDYHLLNIAEFDPFIYRYVHEQHYHTCSHNYSSFSSTYNVRSQLLNHIGLVIGMCLMIFIVLFIVVLVLLNGLQYRLRDTYDDACTTLQRTFSQTSLRRSRKDLRTTNEHELPTTITILNEQPIEQCQ
jgi:hypothetical protein